MLKDNNREVGSWSIFLCVFKISVADIDLIFEFMEVFRPIR